jgi:hypothetical protein
MVPRKNRQKRQKYRDFRERWFSVRRAAEWYLRCTMISKNYTSNVEGRKYIKSRSTLLLAPLWASCPSRRRHLTRNPIRDTAKAAGVPSGFERARFSMTCKAVIGSAIALAMMASSLVLPRKANAVEASVSKSAKVRAEYPECKVFRFGDGGGMLVRGTYNISPDASKCPKNGRWVTGKDHGDHVTYTLPHGNFKCYPGLSRCDGKR